jgi:hypothetical protein
MAQNQFKSGNSLSTKSKIIWRVLQFVFFCVGLTIFTSLLFYPKLGLYLLWNILIPIAPLLLVISVGLWRNVCPLATMVLLPRHLNLSKKKKISPSLQSKLGFLSVIALLLVVPARHLIFNTNGNATAFLLLMTVVTGVIMGYIFDWKSGWCSSLCPIHPVEKLYGVNTLVSLPNAHCQTCAKCTVPCPDSTPNMHPKIVQKNFFQRASSKLLVGGFPGFVWGYFQVPDFVAPIKASNILDCYLLIYSATIVSLLIYFVLSNTISQKHEGTLTKVFAAFAVSCYYWFRIPNLFGFGKFKNEGLLINLESKVPVWGIYLAIIALSAFFFYWLVVRKTNKKSWVIRPAYS